MQRHPAAPAVGERRDLLVRRPDVGPGAAPRTGPAWPGRSPGGRRARPGRSASPGRPTTARCPTSSPRGSGWAARRARRPRPPARPPTRPGRVGRAERPAVAPYPHVRQQPAAAYQSPQTPRRVPCRPPPRPAGQRQAGDDPRPRRAEAGRPGRVQAGKFPAETDRGRRSADPGRNPADDQGIVVPAEHLWDGHRRRVTQPAQPAGLGREAGRRRNHQRRPWRRRPGRRPAPGGSARRRAGRRGRRISRITRPDEPFQAALVRRGGARQAGLAGRAARPAPGSGRAAAARTRSNAASYSAGVPW